MACKFFCLLNLYNLKIKSQGNVSSFLQPIVFKTTKVNILSPYKDSSLRSAVRQRRSVKSVSYWSWKNSCDGYLSTKQKLTTQSLTHKQLLVVSGCSSCPSHMVSQVRQQRTGLARSSAVTLKLVVQDFHTAHAYLGES